MIVAFIKASYNSIGLALEPKRLVEPVLSLQDRVRIFMELQQSIRFTRRGIFLYMAYLTNKSEDSPIIQSGGVNLTHS